jgi:hypothetical protein
MILGCVPACSTSGTIFILRSRKQHRHPHHRKGSAPAMVAQPASPPHMTGEQAPNGSVFVIRAPLVLALSKTLTADASFGAAALLTSRRPGVLRRVEQTMIGMCPRVEHKRKTWDERGISGPHLAVNKGRLTRSHRFGRDSFASCSEHEHLLAPAYRCDTDVRPRPAFDASGSRKV